MPDLTEERADESDFVQGAGCALLVMGALGIAFGGAALLGVSDRIELEFFGIELNDRSGRLLWVGGSAVALVAGSLMLRLRRAP